MATNDSTNTTRASQLAPDEMRGLAQRLRARAQSVLLRHQPEQHRDLLTAASIIEQFANVSTEVLASAAAIDGLTRLLEVAGGA
jgi:hypothetical protein